MAKQTKTATAEVVTSIETSGSGIMTIPGVKPKRIVTLIVGTAILVTHKFDEKTKNDLVEKHKGAAKAGRTAKVPEKDFEAARYRLTDGSDGVPAGGVKACIVDGFGKDTGVFITKAKGGIRVIPDDTATNLVRILTPTPPRMREDVARNANGNVDVRHRPEYYPWAMRLEIEFLEEVCSPQQLLQAIARSGFSVGLCEWRPSSKQSKSGSWGTFRLATPEEVDAFEDGTLFDNEPMRIAAE